MKFSILPLKKAKEKIKEEVKNEITLNGLYIALDLHTEAEKDRLVYVLCDMFDNRELTMKEMT